MGGIKDGLKIIEKTPEEIEKIKVDVQNTGLPEEAVSVILYGLNLILWLSKLILEQRITISRLKELLFDKGQRKQYQKPNDKNASNSQEGSEPDEGQDANESSVAENDDLLGDACDEKDVEPFADEATGDGRNGRNPHTVYKNAIEHHISIEGIKSGHPCPLDCGGKLFHHRPSTMIRIKGSQAGCAHRYIIEKLRCNLCGEIITAMSPEDMGEDKYDASFIAQLGIQEYYMRMPSYRQNGFHSFIDLPLPHTTQWMLLEKLAGSTIPVFNQIDVVK